MKKFLGVFLILANLSFANAGEVVTLDKDSVEKPKIQIETTEKQLKGSLLINGLLAVQKPHIVYSMYRDLNRQTIFITNIFYFIQSKFIFF